MDIPADATKTALAETAALCAIVFARNHRDGLITRLAVEEAMSELFNSERYKSVPHPAYRTVFTQVRKLAAHNPTLTVKLAVTDPENRI